MRLHITLDRETAMRLQLWASRELRPAPLEAEVILRRVLGTWTEDWTGADDLEGDPEDPQNATPTTLLQVEN